MGDAIRRFPQAVSRKRIRRLERIEMIHPAIKEALAKPLNPKLVRQRVGPKDRNGKPVMLDYLSGADAIDQLNRLFGYGGWSQDVTELVFDGKVVRARVNLTILFPAADGEKREFVSREDVGAAFPRDDSAEALENAYKAAVTDAMKRAARTLGPQLGNDLYKKKGGN